MRKRKVVIADDERHIRYLIRSLIDWEKYGLELAAFAHDGNSALEMCEKFSPDFLITDIRMPGLSGIDLVKTLYDSFPETKVIIITGYSHFAYAHQALHYNVTDYLLKPIQKPELERALEKGLEQLGRQTQPVSAQREAPLRSMQKIKDDLLLTILHGNGQMLKGGNADWLSRKYHLTFHGAAWRLMQIEFVLSSEESSASVQEFLEDKIRDIVLERLGNERPETLTAFMGNSFYCLMNGSAEELGQVGQKAVQIRSRLLLVNDILQKINFTIGLSRVCVDFQMIQTCVQDCSRCVADKIIRGKNKLIRFEELSAAEESMSYFLSDNFRRRFQRAVTDADGEAMSAEINDLVTMLYRFSKKIDGSLVLEVYRELVSLFFRGISVYDFSDYREFTRENLECQKDCFYNISEAFTYLNDVFRMLLRRSYEAREDQNSRPVKLAQLYMEEHYTEPLTLEEIAGRVGLNETYLSSIFKKQTGQSVIDFLTATRIRGAKELLLNRNASINEVAEKVGFNDAKYFTKRFKKFTGVSPNEYRKLFS